MGRRDYKNARRPEAGAQAAKTSRKGGGMGTGLVLGIVLGMAIAGGMYWYLNTQPSGLKPAAPPPAPMPPAPARPPAAETEPAPARAPMAGEASAPPVEPPPTKATTVTPPPGKKPDAKKPPPDYSFYDILPGKAAPKPAPPAKTPARPTGQHWLQVAALKSPEDAERLKARLVLLGLPVAIQKVESPGANLHRVRVGPFKTEDDGLGALDTLSENDFEPRWVKDPVNP